MTARHRTHHDRDLATIVNAFHERLAGSPVKRRTKPSCLVSPLHLRDRLALPASAGLRERLRQTALPSA